MNNKIKTSRLNFDTLGKAYPTAKNVIIEKEVIDGVNCYWFYRTQRYIKRRVIVYLHGGCFVLGSINSHQSLLSHLADKLDETVLYIDYSLAPENPFPAAINDILNVYQALINQNPAARIIFMGDSAGAGLAISVIPILNWENMPMPDQLVMLSPWIDLRLQSESITMNAEIDPILTKDFLQSCVEMYNGGCNYLDANPIESMFGKFPPTLIIVGSQEILLDDSKIIYEKIKVDQPNVKLKIYDNQTHVWILDNIDTPPSANALNEIKTFINELHIS